MKRFNKTHVFSILSLLLLSCGNQAPFVWVESLPQRIQDPPPYQIQAGDNIDVTVWNQPQISGSFVVREDGFITVPLVGDMLVAGLTTTTAARAIAAKLEGDIVQNVQVTVISTATAPDHVTVIGEVATPGQIVLKPGDTLLDVLATAGGLTEFADHDGIYVFRHEARFFRIRFDYERLTTSVKGGIRFRLQDGDVVVVE